ncbi:MAG TPA: DUF5302 domain-containing protein [Pseudolysinimonas sp.]|nr:DUF5302 domain-containing protein [Pseudolysinimonas sp.]
MSENEETNAETAPSDDAKRKFREALDRKKAQQSRGAAHFDTESAVHGSQDGSGGKRQFQRRKSG